MKQKFRSIIYFLAILFLTNTLIFPCTFFMATKGGITFFGNNEDMIDSDTNIWFIPGEEGKFGSVYFGFNNGWPQGGMNEHGLCFDGASTPRVNLELSEDKEPYNGNLIYKIMEECTTVEEVIEMAEKYRFNALQGQGQLMFADRKGDAVIIGGPGKDSDIDIIRKKGDYMVLTNFLPNNPQMGGHPCQRYEIANEMLNKNMEPIVENFRSILNAVHVEKVARRSSATVYSNIFDLNNCEIYVYYFHNFSDVVKINLSDELKKGPHAYKIRSLFPESKLPLKALADFDRGKEKMNSHYSLPDFIEFKKDR
ncbi:carcinine hydrolase/isopenicillin-N N-acyltransferase family protein [candidate division KSB1 bacterium]